MNFWNFNEQYNYLTQPVTTESGFCETFNGLDSTEIFREIA